LGFYIIDKLLNTGDNTRSKLAFAILAEPGGTNEGEKGKNIIVQEGWEDKLNFSNRLSFLLIIKEIGWPDPIFPI